MRKLIDGTNVDAVTGDYPNGRTRDKDGGTPGTILNEVLMGDMQQFFQKLIIDASIVENDTPDNVSNGFQLLEALIAKIDEVNGGLKTKIVNIGDWDMDTNQLALVPHGLTMGNIRSVEVDIRNDAESQSGPFQGAGGEANVIAYDSSDIIMSRQAGGVYDGVNYDSTSYNRGWIVIRYIL